MPYECYVISLDQDDYYQHRGGYDWGRAAHPALATQFDRQALEDACRRGAHGVTPETRVLDRVSGEVLTVAAVLSRSV